ncbi:MAG: hypothetical protein ACLUFL_03495 [Flavonifractor plautii]
MYLFVQTKKDTKVGRIMNNTKVKDKDLPKMGKLCILHLYMLFDPLENTTKGGQSLGQTEETSIEKSTVSCGAFMPLWWQLQLSL